jgi:hypothetical protein
MINQWRSNHHGKTPKFGVNLRFTSEWIVPIWYKLYALRLPNGATWS